LNPNALCISITIVFLNQLDTKVSDRIRNMIKYLLCTIC